MPAANSGLPTVIAHPLAAASSSTAAMKTMVLRVVSTARKFIIEALMIPPPWKGGGSLNPFRIIEERQSRKSHGLQKPCVTSITDGDIILVDRALACRRVLPLWRISLVPTSARAGSPLPGCWPSAGTKARFTGFSERRSRTEAASGYLNPSRDFSPALTWTGLAPAGSHQLCGWRTYSITSSAMARSGGGILRPSASAVL